MNNTLSFDELNEKLAGFTVYKARIDERFRLERIEGNLVIVDGNDADACYPLNRENWTNLVHVPA